MKVECYRNLHTGKISVRRAHGNVLMHSDAVMVRDAAFVVQPAGRAKVLREQRKNVHAFVRGSVMGGVPADYSAWPQASYNPYKHDYFFDKVTGSRIDTVAEAVVTTSGVYYKEQ